MIKVCHPVHSKTAPVQAQRFLKSVVPVNIVGSILSLHIKRIVLIVRKNNKPFGKGNNSYVQRFVKGMKIHAKQFERGIIEHVRQFDKCIVSLVKGIRSIFIKYRKSSWNA